MPILNALLWVFDHPRQASNALLPTRRGHCPFRSQLLDVLNWVQDMGYIEEEWYEQIRRHRQTYERCLGAMTANVAVNICIELLAGDVAMLLFLANYCMDARHPLSRIWDRMITAHVRVHQRQTGEHIARLVLRSDGQLQTSTVTRRTVALPHPSVLGAPGELHRFERV
jgi:hypothetical protein